MWQHKQDERELKRTEGDVLKKRYAVRHTLRDYENSELYLFQEFLHVVFAKSSTINFLAANIRNVVTMLLELPLLLNL